MRLLVTGANGQVGWELRRTLAPLGEVLALDRAACDLTRPAQAARAVRDAKPDIIVNAAAYTAVDKAETEEPLATLINGAAVGEIAIAARKLDALFIHFSTDYVFDGKKQAPYSEDDPPHPLNAYGRSKLAGERAIASSGGSYLVLRTSWIYSDRGHNFLRTILRLAAERDELRIVADQIGAPTWARQLAEVTALVAGKAAGEKAAGVFASGLFHLTAGGATSWHGFAQAIVDNAARGGLLGRAPRVVPIASAEYSTPASRPRNSRLAMDRIRARFGIAPAPWREALNACMADLHFP